jgi:hypothetical protein
MANPGPLTCYSPQPNARNQTKKKLFLQWCSADTESLLKTRIFPSGRPFFSHSTQNHPRSTHYLQIDQQPDFTVLFFLVVSSRAFDD